MYRHCKSGVYETRNLLKVNSLIMEHACTAFKFTGRLLRQMANRNEGTTNQLSESFKLSERLAPSLRTRHE